MKRVVWILVGVLVILHHDVWNWHDDTIVFSFLPSTLVYHMCLSVAAGVVWYLATVFAWPDELDEEQADQAKQSGVGRPSKSEVKP